MYNGLSVPPARPPRPSLLTETRFNSFYHEEPHSFVQAVNNTLATASDRAKVGPRLRKMMPWDTSAETVRRDSAYLANTCNDLVKMRRESPKNKQDLLNAMVYDKDTKTGEAMSDGLIIANMYVLPLLHPPLRSNVASLFAAGLLSLSLDMRQHQHCSLSPFYTF